MKLCCMIFLIFCEIHIILTTRISDEKCEEYSKLFESNQEKRQIRDTEFIFDFPPPGKRPTEPGEFPHMARLGYVDRNDKRIFLCGGVLISDQYILTSATCTNTNVIFIHARKRRETTTFPDELEDDDSISLPQNVSVKYIQLGNKISGIQEFSPDQIIIHPEFNDSYRHNIALVKLNKKVQFTKDIRPACLYTNEEDLTNKTVIGTGWGRTAFESGFSRDLMKVDLEVLSIKECKYVEDLINLIDICVGHRNGTNTLCEGDGGAPLQIKNQKYNNMHDIVGIVSIFYTCNLYSFPMIAARITPYISWIENIVFNK